MKTSNLFFTLLYMAFVVANVVVVSMAVIMITLKGSEMADTGLILLFLEAMVFIALKKEPQESIQAS